MGFQHPKRPSHTIPRWVDRASVYHIRIRTSSSWKTSLVQPSIGHALLASVSFYQRQFSWNCRLILLMPDHLHMLVSFPPDKSMSRTIGSWKAYHAKTLGVQWQDNYFDHRIRNDKERSLKHSYNLNNPVVKGLCKTLHDWPWKFENDHP